MSQTDVPDLINSFKEANKTLRKRAVTIGILMFLSIGLTYMEYSRQNDVFDLLRYQEKLEKINDLDTIAFKKVIDGDDQQYFHWNDRCISCYESTNLFKKIKIDNYNRKLLVDAIERIDERIDQLNKDKYFSIVGFSIALDPINYVFFIFMLILFHDFTQILLYRDNVYRRIRRNHVPDWKLGFELFGSYTTAFSSSTLFIRFISSIVTGLFILCPFVTGILMINLRTSVENTALDVINLVCLVFIITDTLIIFHNRSRKFRFWGNFLLGNYNTREAFLKKVWLIILSMFMLILIEDAFLMTNADMGVKIFYFIMNSLPYIFLYFVLSKCLQTTNKFFQGIRTTLLIFNFTWLCLITTRTHHDDFTAGKLEDIFSAFLLVALISGVIAFLYTRYFKVRKKKIR